MGTSRPLPGRHSVTEPATSPAAHTQAGETLWWRLLRERTVVLASVLGISAIAWLYLLTMPSGMPDLTAPAMLDGPAMSGSSTTMPSMSGMSAPLPSSSGMSSMPSMSGMGASDASMAGMAASTPPPAGMTMAMPMAAHWNAALLALTFAMWWVMMLGMMLPSAAPMILTFDRINRGKRRRGQTYVSSAIFVLGYLLVWGAFSVVVTLAQWALDSAALLSPRLTLESVRIGGGVLVLAGIYQFTPWMQTCLRHCRSPFAFLLNNWREGATGALRMGIEHGAWCLGCCWILMALLFVVGVMNLLWIAALALFVFAEKLLPGGPWTARVGGLTMLGFGVYLLV